MTDWRRYQQGLWATSDQNSLASEKKAVLGEPKKKLPKPVPSMKSASVTLRTLSLAVSRWSPKSNA